MPQLSLMRQLDTYLFPLKKRSRILRRPALLVRFQAKQICVSETMIPQALSSDRTENPPLFRSSINPRQTRVPIYSAGGSQSPKQHSVRSLCNYLPSRFARSGMDRLHQPRITTVFQSKQIIHLASCQPTPTRSKATFLSDILPKPRQPIRAYFQQKLSRFATFGSNLARKSMFFTKMTIRENQ